MCRMRWLTLVALLVTASVSVAPGEARVARVALSVSPRDALVDTPVEIRATGLPSRRRVLLQATTKDAFGKTWASRVSYQTSAGGVVDTRSNMRLFWSMQPVSGNGQLGMLPRDVSSVAVSVFSYGKRVARSTVTRRMFSADVQTRELTVATDGLAGTFHARPAIDHLTAHGVPVEAGPFERDAGSRGTAMHVYFRDPDGSLLEFVSYADGA
jgi:Acyl-CoA thioester hydrolase/BAAT N-terminal region